MKIGILSDTHAPRFWRVIPDVVTRHLDGCDLILHAGDVCIPEVLEELSGLAPVQVVQGNNDGPDIAAWGATEIWEETVAGVRLAMVHDSGWATGRAARLRRRFPDADLVVFGHSHIPWDHTVDGQRAFNPGSPSDRRRQKHATMGVAQLQDGEILDLKLIEVD